MNINDKKVRLLNQLSQETGFIGLAELLAKLGNAYNERSVRRWLAEMTQNGLVEKKGSKKGTLYKILNQEEKSLGQSSTCFSSESLEIIALTKRPRHERNSLTYSDSWFNAYQPNVSYYIPPKIRQQLDKAGKRAEKEEPAGTYAHKIFNRLLIDLSYNSSRLEGNTYSLLDTQRLLLEGTSAEGKLDEEKIMILNHKEAIRYLVDTATRLEVTSETIYTLHYLLSDGLLEPCYAGKVRDHAVGISGSVYVPYEDPRQLQQLLKSIAEKAKMIKNTHEQSFFLLVHVTYLQAFADVNKRTGRLCANIPLIQNNYVPLSCNDIERSDYASAMIAIYELQDVRPLLDLYFFSYLKSCVLYDTTVKAVGFDEIRVRYRLQRRALLREVLVNQLSGKTMHEYISSQAAKLVHEENRPSFIEDVFEDLREMDLARLAGLGVTPAQLTAWMAVQQS
jgi:hypothetical protein